MDVLENKHLQKYMGTDFESSKGLKNLMQYGTSSRVHKYITPGRNNGPRLHYCCNGKFHSQEGKKKKQGATGATCLCHAFQ